MVEVEVPSLLRPDDLLAPGRVGDRSMVVISFEEEGFRGK